VTGAMMFVSPVLFQRIGWRGVASASPTILLYGGVTFFLAALANRMAFPGPVDILAVASANQVLVLQGLAFGGALLYILNRGCKFSLFKPAEEMVYITLDQESRTKGKAAIDVVGAQTGKSVSSVLQQVLLLVSNGNFTLVLPVMMAFQVGILRSWLHAVFVLSKYHEKTTRRQLRIEAGIAAAAARGMGGDAMGTAILDSNSGNVLEADLNPFRSNSPAVNGGNGSILRGGSSGSGSSSSSSGGGAAPPRPDPAAGGSGGAKLD
jgi:ATP:ADP antiporter, AAA family